MANDYSRWYRVGTVNVTNGSKIVTGTDTYWLAASLHAGDIFSIDSTKSYEIETITDNTHITLKTVYGEAAASGVSYEIVRNFTATLPAEVASQTSELLYDVRRYIDTDMKSLYGKSAYEVAVKNGYTGTEAQWLASLVGKSAYEVAQAGGYTGTQAEWLSSLIGAGQWDILNERTALLENPTWVTKNNMFSGKYLGPAPTEEQLAHIADNTFEGLGLGDYWRDSQGMNWRIHAFNYYYNMYGNDNYADPVTGETRSPNWKTAGRSVVEETAGFTPGGWMPPHVIVMPDQPLATDYYVHPDAEDQLAGYFQSYWYTNVRPAILQRIIDTFGDEHVLEWVEPFPTRYIPFGSSALINYVHSYGRCEIPKYGHINPHEWMTWYGTGGVYRGVNGPWAKVMSVQFALERIAMPTTFFYYWYANHALRECYATSGGKLYMHQMYHSNDIHPHPEETTATRAFQPYFCLG